MAQSIGDMISEILSAMNSPSAIWDRQQRAKENETALNNEDYRKRKLLEMQEAGSTTREGMRVAGSTDVENIKNTGAMARQQLVGRQGMEIGQQRGEFDLEGHKMTSGAAITASENRLTGDTRRAEATENAATIGAGSKTDARAKLLETWAGGPYPTLESLDVVMKGYDKLYPNKKPEVMSPTGEDRGTFYSPSVGSVPNPTPKIRTIPPVQIESPTPVPASNKVGFSLIGRQEKPWWERRKKQLEDLDESKFGKFITGR